MTGAPPTPRRASSIGGATGFTLVELLVGLGLLALFSLAMQQYCRTVLRGVRVLEVASEAQEAARLAVQLMVADLREAGYGPTGGLGNGIRLATPAAVEIVRDLSGDGDLDDSNERVGYRVERGMLLRSQGNAAPQPLLNDVAAAATRFTFLGDGGAALGGGELDDGARARVRRIGIAVAIEIRHPDPADGRPIRVHQYAVVSLRNA